MALFQISHALVWATAILTTSWLWREESWAQYIAIVAPLIYILLNGAITSLMLKK